MAERPGTIINKQIEKLVSIFAALDAAADELANEEKLTPLEKKRIEEAIAKVVEFRDRIRDQLTPAVEAKASEITAIAESLEEAAGQLDDVISTLEGIES